MKVLVSGARGFIGSALVPFLQNKGHQVEKLTRDHDPDAILWDPESEMIDNTEVEGFDAFINLSGENIAGRWSNDKMQKIRDSRINTTRLLVETIAQLNRPPKVLVNASAIGYYGDQRDRICTEETPRGSGFLAEVCAEWEAAALAAQRPGLRVVLPRFGVVLSKQGGALTKMLPAFKLGLGGILGNGKQYVSWIALDDLLEAIHTLVVNEQLQGPFNIVSPNPVTNEVFTKTLGKVLHRPTIFPVPAFVLKLLFGKMAEDTLLSSTRAVPSKLEANQFRFRHPELEGALKFLC